MPDAPARPPLVDETASQPDLILPCPTVTVASPDGVPLSAQLVAEPADRVARLSWLGRAGLVIIPITLVGLVWGGPTGYFDVIRETLNPPVAQVGRGPADGALLFAKNCAYCHGTNGRGDGIAALTTKARYFGAEPFKFGATTGTKVPTDDQLVALLKRGIAGSSMPSFAHLHDDELQAIVGHVRALTRKGKYESTMRKMMLAADDGDGDYPDPVAVHTLTDAACVPGEPVPVPTTFPPPSAESLANGRRLFLAVCASCHGPEGRGDGPQVAQMKNDDGSPARPRNLTTGVYKGGESHADLYVRIVNGIPGTPMPAGANYTPDEARDLVNFVLSLADADP